MGPFRLERWARNVVIIKFFPPEVKKKKKERKKKKKPDKLTRSKWQSLN